MANDKVYIRCKGCGNLVFLAKFYPSAQETIEDGEWGNPGVREFINRHRDMCFALGQCLGGDFGFEFICESAEGFRITERGPEFVPPVPAPDSPAPSPLS